MKSGPIEVPTEHFEFVCREETIMNYAKLTRATLVAAMGFLASPAIAADVDKIHFLIPGGAGGGWDGTARGTGEALTKAGIVGPATEPPRPDQDGRAG